ncbi:MAG: hypothetical protein R3182_13795, partial [Draconibacterium sp.]|nr:hypothetical protein [Draconibacterium sp.]
MHDKLNKMYSDLISKYLNREASEAELKQLNDWINESESNKELFAELKNSHALASSKLASDNRTSDYKELINQSSNISGKITLPKLYRIAAAVFFPVLMAVSIWLLYQQYYTEESPFYTEVIAPSKSTSQIVLSDGSQVWL